MTRISRRARFAIVPEWVITHAGLSDRAVRVYALLVRYADAEGESYHSRKKIAATLHTSTPSLDRALAELVEVGALTVEPRFRPDGSRSSNNYTVEHEPPSSPETTALLTGDEGALFTRDEGASSPVTKQEGEPDNESQLIEKTDSGLSPLPGEADDFEIFWQAVPRARRVGKGDARKAWNLAMRPASTPAARRALAERIIQGMHRYADETAGRDPKYLKTPGPWLRAERWLDEPGANRDGRARPSGAGAGAIIGRDPAAPQGRVAAGDL